MITYNTVEREEVDGDVVTTEAVATATVDGLYLEVYLNGQEESEIQEAFQVLIDHAAATDDYDLDELKARMEALENENN